MLFLPKVKKDDPCLKATKKVKSLVASLLAAVAVAVSGAAYAGPTGVSGFLCLGRLFQGQPNEAALCI